MLVALLYFWENTTNTFQLSCGMLTPTLFDIATINGLRPTGKTFDHNESDEDTISFDDNHASLGKYIGDYHVVDRTEVSNE